MGFLDSLFGGKKDHPPLDTNSAAGQHILNMKEYIEKACQESSDQIELIPSENTAYMFLGSPPKRFALTWIEKDGTSNSLKALVQEKGVPAAKIEGMVGTLGAAYRECKNEDRYSMTLGGKQITVTPSDNLAGKIKEAIEATNG